ncbi:MAG: type IV toxin-antitoxin system AbiEi family antitoxin domain-containing protein [Clostridiales bacterium]
MYKNIKEKAKIIFKKNNGYVKTSFLLNSGIDKNTIKNLVESNSIIRIKRGIYKWAEYQEESYEEMIEVSKSIPKGVFCLFTALSYYDLTTYIPYEFDIAICRGTRKPIIPDYPPVKVHYFSDKNYNLGIKHLNINNHEIKIYDMEKTICDAVRFRNTIGFDLVKESLKEYIKRNDRNIGKIIEYSKITNVITIIKPLLEVLT